MATRFGARTRLTFLLVSLLCAPRPGGPSRVSAQQVDEQVGEQDPDYREAVRLAIQAYEQNQLGVARLQFERAHARFPNARTLRGLGTVELELGEYVPAVSHLRSALDSTVLPLAGPLREETEAALGEALAHVGSLQVLASPAEVRIQLDGREVTGSASWVLAPGKHRLELWAEGYRPQVRELVVSASQHQLIELVLQPQVVTPPSLPSPTIEPAATLAPAPRLQHVKPWLVVAAGGAVLVTGVALLAAGAHERKVVADPSEGEITYQDFRASQDRYPRLLISGGSLLGAGALSIAAGLYWRSRLLHAHDVHVALGVDQLLVRGSF